MSPVKAQFQIQMDGMVTLSKAAKKANHMTKNGLAGPNHFGCMMKTANKQLQLVLRTPPMTAK